MNPSVCTLFESDFHYGLGALVNSLVHHGYEGIIWAGYRGPLPKWASKATRESGWLSLPIRERVDLRFVELQTTTHFTHFKPWWMIEVARNLDREAEALFYFDPDIVVTARWSYFQEWISHGIALCGDTNYHLGSHHPIRLAWIAFAQENGWKMHRSLDGYCNGGFLGIKREYLEAVELWRDLIATVEKESGSLKNWRSLDRTHRFFSANQDTLNLMAMITEESVAIMGPDAMAFVPGPSVMAHAVGAIKPWNRRMTWSALGGVPPSAADKGYWAFCSGPIRLYSEPELMVRKIDLLLGSAIGRVVRRN